MISTVSENVASLIRELPPGVLLEAAVKTRSAEEILDSIAAGVKIIGENYVQEAEDHYKSIGNKAEWHLIGHLQKNKAKKAAELFQMIETVDSMETAKAIDRACLRLGKVMPVLIEVNSGRETQKEGVFPENVEALARELATLKNIRLMGLMTMGPELHEPEGLRPYFRETKVLIR